MSEWCDNISVKDPVAIFNGNTLKAVKYTVIYVVNKVQDKRFDNKLLLQSPIFHVGQDDKYQARITCSFAGGCDLNIECTGFGCVFVEFLADDKSTLIARRDISFSYIKNDQTRTIHPEIPIMTCEKPTSTLSGKCLNGYYLFNITNWLSNEKLSIVCDITIHQTTLPANENVFKPTNTVPVAIKSETQKNLLMSDIKRTLGNTELTDVTLKVGGKTIQVHKFILAARSPVFARMFQTEMSESKLNVVEIKDMRFDAVRSLLVYMYTDNVSVTSLDTLGGALLAAAEKYQLEGLKEKCEVSLAKGLTVANAARMFTFAELHRAKHLKAKAVEFIGKNREKVFATAEWKKARDENPLEMAALFL